MAPPASQPALRGVVAGVAALNLGYFGVEFAVALTIGSVALMADSVDFLEDAAVNGLIALALGWSLARRARVGMVMAGLILIPSLATLWMLITKLGDPVPPPSTPMALAGLGALAVNLLCARMLLAHRHSGGSLTRAAFLSARNDALANLAILVAAGLTAWTLSGWPDIVAGAGIALLNATAAREVWEAARGEAREAREARA